MRNRELQLERGATMTEYARTLSVLTVFCLAAFAVAAAVGYLT
jgi:Flp pilus assembly pilin Flp